jgi:hypothetical protein
MVGASKILTVSYGTFSCTLEGFEDPFSTMRSIAEYFRDLAADDRYFGAEPPTPDAEMLHKIAEKEVQRRVEARVSDDGIVLRQMDSDAPAAAAVAVASAAVASPVIDNSYEDDAGAPETFVSDTVVEDDAIDSVEPSEGGSVADKLSRIRAVVSRGDAELDGTDTYEEPVADAEEVEVEAPIEDSFEDSVEVEAYEDVASHDETAAMLEDQLAADDVEEDVIADAYEDLGEDSADTESSLEAATARIVDLKRDDENMVDPIEDDEAPALLDEDEDLAASLSDAMEDSALSDEDEADLMQELAAVEDEDEEDDLPANFNFEEARRREDEANALSSAISDTMASSSDESYDDEGDNAAEALDQSSDGDDAFDRILEETNTQMDDSEGSRRRSAIAHLKAAVAATKADRLMDKLRAKEQADQEEDQYRDDLAQVVRPSETPPTQVEAELTPVEDEEPAPLVLVSEQRIEGEDEPEIEETAAVAPRRVSAEDIANDSGDNIFQADTSFPEFAEKMGATELPDLLEAAAAYSAFVEGREHFSRPQLMKRVASFEADQEFNREAGLRSFGQLLRQGKIQKLKRGQFTIREDTRFNPEARIAGE